MREVETKFRVSDDVELPDLTGAGPVAAVARPDRFSLRATYYDTEDLRLARWGVTLRSRTGGHDEGWHLKLPAGPVGSREEIGLPAGGRAVPAELRELVLGYSRGAALRPVARLDTDRTSYQLLDAGGGPLAELVDDLVSVRSGRSVVASFREIEVEAAPGLDEPGPLFAAVGQVLTTAGAVGGEFVPKAVRALGSRATEPADPPPGTGAGKHRPVGEVVTDFLRGQVRTLIALDPQVRRDVPDAVHQMRITARRLRAGIITFGGLLDEDAVAPVLADLKWLTTELGGARDDEVVLERLTRVLAGLPPQLRSDEAAAVLTEALSGELADATAELAGALRGRRYLGLLDALVALATDPPLTRDAGRPAAKALPGLVRRDWRRVTRRAKRLQAGADSDEDWHALRRALRRLRYATEMCVPVLGKAPGRFAPVIKDLQDVLGDHQDAVTAAARLEQLAGSDRVDGRTGFTLGLLHAQARGQAGAARSAFRPAWHAARRGTLRRWLES